MLGVLSLIFWSLILVVSVKYVVFVMRADLNGEGGILALMALARAACATSRRAAPSLVALGLFGAALLYGDGMITPAISVLSAVEGLKVATPVFGRASCRITVAVLVGCSGSSAAAPATVGAVFGPVMVRLVRRASPLLGLRWIAAAPQVLAAFSPHHAARFLADGGWTGYLILGSVFLAVTGGEALYADIGHFGTRPIRLMWFAVVLPAVLINYFGQGAMLLQQPDAVHHTFFSLAPQWALVSAGRAGHRGRGDRLAGGDRRRVLADRAGAAARLRPAPRGAPLVGRRRGPGLRAAGELAAARRRRRAGARISAPPTRSPAPTAWRCRRRWC